jgi:hypothetical protein
MAEISFRAKHRPVLPARVRMTDQTPLSGFPENLAQNAPPIIRKRSYVEHSDQQ